MKREKNTVNRGRAPRWAASAPHGVVRGSGWGIVAAAAVEARVKTVVAAGLLPAGGSAEARA